MTPAPVYVSLREAAELELLGAKHRLDLAMRGCKDFLAEHGGQVASPELQASFERERFAVETELDSARRRYAECARQYAELKEASSQDNPGKTPS
jgi:hypothetical protein